MRKHGVQQHVQGGHRIIELDAHIPQTLTIDFEPVWTCAHGLLRSAHATIAVGPQALHAPKALLHGFIDPRLPGRLVIVHPLLGRCLEVLPLHIDGRHEGDLLLFA